MVRGPYHDIEPFQRYDLTFELEGSPRVTLNRSGSICPALREPELPELLLLVVNSRNLLKASTRSGREGGILVCVLHVVGTGPKPVPAPEQWEGV